MKSATLAGEVKSHIESWLTAKPSRNLTALARFASVSESCIRRLYNDGREPISDNLLKILTAISGKSSLEDLKGHFNLSQAIQSFLLKNYSFLETSTYIDKCTPLLEKEQYLDDYFSFVVYAMASNRKQINRSDIVKMFGMMGEMALDSLVTQGFLKIEPNGDIMALITDIRPSKELIKKHLPDLTKMFFKVNHEFNGYALQSESVSREGYGRAMDVFEKFLADMGDVIQKYPGDVPLVVSGFMDTMTLEPYFRKEESK